MKCFTLKGLNRLQPNPEAIERDINRSWEVLGEAIQTVMRRYGIAEPYEKLKALTRGQAVTEELLREFISSLEIPDEAKNRLREMTPASYTGLASSLARLES